MTNRQQLARRLYNILWGAKPALELNLAPPVDTNPHDKPWLNMADECLRQMKWVAFQTAHSYRSSEGYEDKADALEDSANFVALAPEDWNP